MERDAVGIGDRYSNMQYNSAPAIDKYFIGKRLDICLQYFIDDGGTRLPWIQREIILVSDGKNPQIIKVDKRATRTARLL